MIHIELNQEGQKTVVTNKYLRWFAAVWFLLGLLAVVVPLVSTMALEFLLTSVLLVAGAARSVMALSGHGTAGWVWSLSAGIVIVALGMVLLFNPNAGVLTLGLLLIVFLVLEAAIGLALALQLRAAAVPWRGLALSGVLNAVLASLIVFGWPQTANWVPGIVAGISMMSAAFVLWRLTAAH